MNVQKAPQDWSLFFLLDSNLIIRYQRKERVKKDKAMI